MDGSKKKKYKYDLFIKDEGNVRRLTRLYGQIHGAAISPNKNIAVFIFESYEENKGMGLWTVNSDGTGLREIKIPWQTIIN